MGSIHNNQADPELPQPLTRAEQMDAAAALARLDCRCNWACNCWVDGALLKLASEGTPIFVAQRLVIEGLVQKLGGAR
jgi:hypothetical protein